MALKVTHADARKLVRHDLAELAPKFRQAVEAAVAECATAGYPVRVYEVLRTHELAEMYFELKASKSRNGWKTWHFFGLAVDVIHPVTAWAAWDNNPKWRSTVVRIFKKHGMKWGGDWTSFVDMPHFQWGLCKASPSDNARRLFEKGGREAVWREVGAAADSIVMQAHVLPDDQRA